MDFTFGTHDFTADASGALWWPAARTLIVADLHLEKGSAFGTRGQFLPPYDSLVTLERLAAVAAQYGAARILTLGDNVHDAKGWDRLSLDLRAQLQSLAHAYELLWLFGNHDRLQSPPVGTALRTLHEAGLSFGHEPELRQTGAWLTGHLHPCVCLPTAAGHSRVRCFMVSANLLILPAFGTYTGGLDIVEEVFAPYLEDTAQLLLCSKAQVHRLPLAAYRAALSRAKPARRA